MLTPGWKLALGITKGVQSFLVEKKCNTWFVLKTLQFSYKNQYQPFPEFFHGFS